MHASCPPELAACAPKLGWTVVDDMWCTIVAMEGCRQNGLSWVLNPWDDLYHEFDILQCGWTWVQQQVRGDSQVAKAVLVATERAAECVSTWRESFTATMQALHEQKKAEEAEKKREAAKKRPSFGSSVQLKSSYLHLSSVLEGLTAIPSFVTIMSRSVSISISAILSSRLTTLIFCFHSG